MNPFPFQQPAAQDDLAREYLTQLDRSAFDLWVTRILFSKLGDMANVSSYLNVYQRRVHSLVDAVEMSLDGLCQALDSLMVEPDRSTWSLKGTSTGYQLVPGSKPCGYPVFVDEETTSVTRLADDGRDICQVCWRPVDVLSNCTACCDELLNKLEVESDVAVPIYFSADCCQLAGKLVPGGELRPVDGFLVYIAHVKVRFPAVAMFTNSADVLLGRVVEERKAMLNSCRNLLASGDVPLFPETVGTRADLVLTDYVRRFGVEMGWLVFITVAGVPWSLVFEAKGFEGLIDRFWGSDPVALTELHSWLATTVRSTAGVHGWSMDLSEGSLELDDLLAFRDSYSTHSLELIEILGFGFLPGDSLMLESGFSACWVSGRLFDSNGSCLCLCCFSTLEGVGRLCSSCDAITRNSPTQGINPGGPVSSDSGPSSGSLVSSSTDSGEIPAVKREPDLFFSNVVGSTTLGRVDDSEGHEWHAGGGVSFTQCDCGPDELAVARRMVSDFISCQPSLFRCSRLPVVNYSPGSFYFPHAQLYDSSSEVTVNLGTDMFYAGLSEVGESLESAEMSSHALRLLVMAGLMASFRVVVKPRDGVFPAVVVYWQSPVMTGYSADVAWFVVPHSGPAVECDFTCLSRTLTAARLVGLRALCLNASLRSDLSFPADVFGRIRERISNRDVHGAAVLAKQVFHSRFIENQRNRYYILEVEDGFATQLDRQCLTAASKALRERISVPMEYRGGRFSVDLTSLSKTLMSKHLELVVAAYRLSEASELLDSNGAPTALYDCLYRLHLDDVCSLI